MGIINTINYGTWIPSKPTDVLISAFEDRLEFTWNYTPPENFYGNIIFIPSLKYNGVVRQLPEYTTETKCVYYFDRDVDGYPESDDNAEAGDTLLSLYSFKVYAVNTENSEAYLNNGPVSDNTAYPNSFYLTNYGTWHIPAISVTNNVTKKSFDRTVYLTFSKPESATRIFGNIKWKVQIKRCGIQTIESGNSNSYPSVTPDSIWYKPNLLADPFADDTNYKVLSSVTNWVISDGTFMQILPLAGQNDTPANSVNTVYNYAVQAFNEVHESNWIGKGSGQDVITAISLCTSLSDIIRANEDFKSLYVQSISAICANVGLITDGGFGDFLGYNYWALSSLTEQDSGVQGGVKKGSFRVGDSNQFIKMTFDNNGVAKLEMTTDHVEFTSTNTRFLRELIVHSDGDELDQIRITPSGVFIEHRNKLPSGSYTAWQIQSRLDSSGTLCPTFRADSQMIIGNFTQQQLRRIGHDIGRQYLTSNAKVFHFDDDYLSQRGVSDGLILTGTYGLKGHEDSSGGIDFTPAILAVAPYCTIARCLFGQFDVTIEETMTIEGGFTVDFWMQYLYSESQTLFDIGTFNDKVKLEVIPSEPVAVVSGVASWTLSDGQVAYGTTLFTATRNPKAGDYAYTTQLAAEQNESSSLVISSVELSGDYDVICFTVNFSGTTNTYAFSTGAPDMNWETYAPEEAWTENNNIANRADDKRTRMTHYGQTATEQVDLEDIGIELEHKNWYHIGVVFDGNVLRVLINTDDHEFTRYAETDTAISIVLNSHKTSFILDELYIDYITENTVDFTRQTENRIPWAANSSNQNLMIFDAQDPTSVKSNILDAFKANLLTSDEFRNAVQEIIGE
ncbi:MAG: hypothetical protein KBT02_08960 [Treponema sp.]|nr:hypothetical protein [Candidatus Treponema caballi]